MRILDIGKFENSIVLHFDTEDTRINAYTFASTLVALADAAKAANTSVNPGCEIEVVVEVHGHVPRIRQMPLSEATEPRE